MKRVSRTRLKIRPCAVQQDEAPLELELPTISRKQQQQQELPTISRKQQQQQQKQVIEEQITKPILLTKFLVIDSKESRNALRNAGANDLKNVERVTVKGQFPSIFDEKFQLRRRFMQDPGLLFREDNDKESQEIRRAFEYFWQYEMNLRLFAPGTTLEIEDCFIYPQKHLVGAQFDTLLVGFSDDMVYQIKLPVLSLNPPEGSVLERIIVGRNVVIDCTNLDIEMLVCMNLLSYGDTIQKARSIRRLIILNEMNPIRDADPERGDMVAAFPMPKGMHTIFFPECQEFEYNHYVIQNSKLAFVGIIPSAYYPSRMSVGVQKTWQPIHRESLERDFVELIRG